MSNPFGRAIRDHYQGSRSEPLYQRDGEEALEHPIEQFYFAYEAGDDPWLESRLDGPLLDLGAGAGQHVLVFQDLFEAVGIEVSEALVETMDARGVEDARLADMFALREHFERDRFASALAHGPQLGLAGSMDGLRVFFAELAYVTTPTATAVVDGYDPGHEDTRELLGYRDDPTPGLGYRVMWFEYEGDRGDVFLFRLFSPGRVREAMIGTEWDLTEVVRGDDNSHHYRAVLEKTELS